MTEKEFASKIVEELKKYTQTVFQIESEETVKGFPDILYCVRPHVFAFFELKIINNSVLKLQKTQLVFAKKHSKNMNIALLAYDNNTKGLYYIPSILDLEKVPVYKSSDKQLWYKSSDITDFAVEAGFEVFTEFCRVF